MLKTFRALSLIEGLSLITLFFVAMPAKYYFGVKGIVFPVGMTHGILWLAYLVVSLIVSHRQSWSVVVWALSLLASVIPFGFVFIELKIRKQLKFATESA